MHLAQTGESPRSGAGAPCLELPQRGVDRGARAAGRKNTAQLLSCRSRLDVGPRLLQRLAPGSVVLPLQTLGELYNVLVRKAKRRPARARDAVLTWRDAYTTIDTSAAVMVNATDLASTHGLSIWDSVVLAATAAVPARPSSMQPGAASSAGAPAVPAEALSALSWRAIGPAMFAGRVADVAGVPGNPDVLYVGTASSGLYKSTNGGVTFDSVFESGNTLSIGAIAVQPDNPDVVYVGTGEGTLRDSASFGNGMYRSDDAGATWRHLGLDETQHIGKVAVHPEDPELVYVAAIGNLYRSNPERGLFRSRDGGRSWEHLLGTEDV